MAKCNCSLLAMFIRKLATNKISKYIEQGHTSTVSIDTAEIPIKTTTPYSINLVIINKQISNSCNQGVGKHS